VPKNGFEVPGTIFERMFALPPGNDENQFQGTNLDSPIFLEGVAEDQFRAFLRVLYTLQSWVAIGIDLLHEVLTQPEALNSPRW
jgi:hypothetical protein